MKIVLLSLVGGLPSAAAFHPPTPISNPTRYGCHRANSVANSVSSLRYANGDEDAPAPENDASAQTIVALPDDSDPFTLLSLTHSQSNDRSAIKSAFRKMSRKHHPDMIKPTSEEDRRIAHENFSKINAAYQELLGRQRSMGSDEFGAESFLDPDDMVSVMCVCSVESSLFGRYFLGRRSIECRYSHQSHSNYFSLFI